MRELFRQARSYPQGCIVFIDEIDAIGRKRYSTSSVSHAEQTLNQLLNELDGFHPRDNIVILGATNSLRVLDSALLRPGRFDRQVLVDRGDDAVGGRRAGQKGIFPSLE